MRADDLDVVVRRLVGLVVDEAAAVERRPPREGGVLPLDAPRELRRHGRAEGQAATDRIAPVVVALVRSAGIFLNMSIPRRPPMLRSLRRRAALPPLG